MLYTLLLTAARCAIILLLFILATSVIGPTNGAAIRTVCSGTVCLTAGWAGPHIGTPTGWNTRSTVLRMAGVYSLSLLRGHKTVAELYLRAEARLALTAGGKNL